MVFTLINESLWMKNECLYAPVLVSDLEQKVQRSKRDRRHSLHRTQLLESQMKTVRGELVGTLDHLQELRNILRRSQQNAEDREAAMQKLAAGLRWDATCLPAVNGLLTTYHIHSSHRKDFKALFIWNRPIYLTALIISFFTLAHIAYSCATRCYFNIYVKWLNNAKAILKACFSFSKDISSSPILFDENSDVLASCFYFLLSGLRSLKPQCSIIYRHLLNALLTCEINFTHFIAPIYV